MDGREHGDAAWQAGLRALRAHVAMHSRLPAGRGRVATWMLRQRTAYKMHKAAGAGAARHGRRLMTPERARLLEAAGYRVLAVDASKWLALQGKSDEEAGGGGGGGGAAAARDAALAALLRPLLLSDDGE